jgi:ribosomal protein S18 acetylase RimI-like enzyme
VTDLSRHLDRIAADAFPAIENVDLDGWILRASGLAPWARTRSVWTAHAGDSLTMTQRLAAVRAFYDGRPYPPLFMVCDHSHPAGLPDALMADGWSPWDGAQVQAVTPSPPLSGDRWCRVPAQRVSTDAWSEASRVIQGWDDATAAANADLLTRTPGTVVGVAATGDNGSVIGLGRGVVFDGWLGIFAMITAADDRGRGVGASVVAELLRQGAALGAVGAYLQVERHNTAALALYRAAGFTGVYDYDYWAPSEASTRDSYC